MKDLLRENTDLAMKAGAFGLPWYVAINAAGERDTFWGFDHLGAVADHLGVKRPTGRSAEGSWKVML